MRFKRHLQLEQGLRQIYIIPLINILLLLLVFFMFTPRFTEKAAMTVNLPKAVTSESVKREFIELVVLADNRVYLNHQIITLEDLEASLKYIAARKPTILIKSDRQVTLERITSILDLCRKNGLSQISIATGQQ